MSYELAGAIDRLPQRLPVGAGFKPAPTHNS
jgi:hypothetical protein